MCRPCPYHGLVYDTYDVMHPGRNNLPAVTGKPVDIGGSLGCREATAGGCLFATQRALARGVVAGLTSVDGCRVAYRGFWQCWFHSGGAF